MSDNRYISIAVYSSIVPSNKPETYLVEVTATARSLMVTYLKKHRLQLIDPNLINVWRIKSRDDMEFGFKITDGISDRVNADDLIITPEQLLREEFYDYYLSFERGMQIKVNVTIDRSKPSCQMMLISTVATASLIIHLIHDYIQITKSSRLIVRHKTGMLKGNENLVSLIRNSNSDEFFIDLNRSLQYNKADKEDIVKRLKFDYDKRNNAGSENKIDKINNNLSKTLYHDKQQNHRKLPDLMGLNVERSPTDIPQHAYTHYQNMCVENHVRQELNRRSLPLIPFEIESPSGTLHINSKDVVKKTLEEEKTELDKYYPPEPILRTNDLDNDKSSSSTTSITSTSDTNSITGPNTCRESIILKHDVNKTSRSYVNLYHIVKYFDLHSIDIFVERTVSSPPLIEFSLRSLKDVVGQLENRPRGPNPTMGGEKSAFKTIEPSSESSKLIVMVVKNLQIQNRNISKGDIFVDIDGENVLSKSGDYINLKLMTNSKHSIVMAKLRNESKNNEKDEKINNLKAELDILKRKYSDLNNTTVDNDLLIKQLTKVLRKQDITSDYIK